MPWSSSSGCTQQTIDGVEKYNCTERRIFASARERWWYIAASHCQPLTVSWYLKKDTHPWIYRLIAWCSARFYVLIYWQLRSAKKIFSVLYSLIYEDQLHPWIVWDVVEMYKLKRYNKKPRIVRCSWIQARWIKLFNFLAQNFKSYRDL